LHYKNVQKILAHSRASFFVCKSCRFLLFDFILLQMGELLNNWYRRASSRKD